MEKKEYLESADDVISSLSSSPSGLSDSEASKRLSEYGRNKLEEKKKDGIIKQFLSKLADPMLIILMICRSSHQCRAWRRAGIESRESYRSSAEHV